MNSATTLHKAFLWAVLGVIALAVLLLAARPAFAHAALARAIPAPNAVLDASPERVQVWFTEPVAPAFSEIRVFDAQGRRVDKGGTTVDSRDPTRMSVAIETLGQGTYTVAWKNVSTVDGHGLVDSFVFSIGEPITQPAETKGKQPLLAYPMEPAVRWLVLLGAMTLIGGIVFDLAVAGPALGRGVASDALRDLRATVTGRRRRMLWVALAVFVGASLLQLLFQAASASGVAPYRVWDLGGPLASILSDTHFGAVWLWRMGLAGALGILLRWKYSRPTARGRGQIRPPAFDALPMALVTASGLLLTLSLVSHSAALQQIKGQAVLTDFLHLLGTGVWVGGLLHLAASIPPAARLESREHPGILATLVNRFSAIATLCIGALIATGVFSAWAQVTSPSALPTPYGVTLLAKVALAAVMLLLGATNLFIIKPKLASGDAGRLWLGRLVAAEAVLGVLVVGAAGVLTSLEPARQAVEVRASGLTIPSLAGELSVTTTVDPGQAGSNTLRLTILDARGQPVRNVQGVDLRLTYLGAELGELVETARAAEAGVYELKDLLLSVAGIWQAEVVVRRADAFDARATFRFELAQAQVAQGLTPSARTGQLLLALEMGLIGIVFAVVGLGAGGMATRSGLALLGVASAAIIAGFGVGANLAAGPTEAARNPFPPDATSLAAGRQVYAAQCLSCHGVAGRGDGPASARLPTRPMDLATHVPLHPDSNLYQLISDGRPGTAMTPYKDKLSRDEIWHVINYLRTFKE